LIHHRVVMILPPYPYTHRCHPRPHTRWYHWFTGPTSLVELRPIAARWWWGWHHSCRFLHLHLMNPCIPMASPKTVRHPCNFGVSGCLALCFWSRAPQAPLQRWQSQDTSHCQRMLLLCWWPW
jgi:hypothetical protein